MTALQATARTGEELRARVVQLETALAEERANAKALGEEHARLRKAFQQLKLELELLRKRIFVATAERVNTAQLELEFADKKAALEALVTQLPEESAAPTEAPGTPPPPAPPTPPPAKPKTKPTGRRDLRDLAIVEERHELLDSELEGKAERIGFEETVVLGWRKGGPVRVVVARGKYRTLTEEGTPTVTTVAMPPRTFGRCLAAPSLLAKILVDKFCDGLPLFRQEQRFEREGLDLDRGTMSRWAEDAGMTVGCVVHAMKDEAFRTAFCIATDATGISIQPEPRPDKGRQPCRKGHFFVMLADRDHVLFEYMPKETSAAVASMFRGYSGYVQADAKSVYDAMFRGPPPEARSEPSSAGERRLEVGCWSHARRKFYEAAAAKDPIAREGLWRIHKFFELERSWAGVPPARRKLLRNQFTRPLVNAFFAWADAEYEKARGERGMLRSAFGYAVRQRDALTRFLDDGRLRLENNPSERALRTIAVGRKAWLFVGSDDHAQAAANLFSLIASCRLHSLDPEAYLRDLFRVLPHWPRDRHIELAPRHWAATHARLRAEELQLPFGPLTVPECASQKSVAD